MQNQLPNKEHLEAMLSKTEKSLNDIIRLINLAEANKDFQGVARLYEIRLGLENVLVQGEAQLNQLKALEKAKELVKNDNNKQS